MCPIRTRRKDVIDMKYCCSKCGKRLDEDERQLLYLPEIDKWVSICRDDRLCYYRKMNKKNKYRKWGIIK